MQELRIVLVQVGPLLLTILGAISWNQRPLLALALWAVAAVIALFAIGVEIRDHRISVAETRRREQLRTQLTILIDRALSDGERLEYNVRDDKNTGDPEAMYQRHFQAFERWREEVHAFLAELLRGTAAANRFKTADGAYNVGKLGFEVARLRRQRENLALIYDNLDAYIARSSAR